MEKVNFGFKQSCHQNEQNTPILALENLKKWYMRRLAYEVKSLDPSANFDEILCGESLR